MQNNNLEKLALKITRGVGSPASILLHSVFFLLSFSPLLFGVEFEKVLLFLTTVVSLEAIYLNLLIQLTVNKNTENLLEVEKDIDEMKVDVDEIQKDVDEIQEDVDEIAEDVDEIEKDIDEIAEDVDEIEKDIDEIEIDSSEDLKKEEDTKEVLKTIYEKLDILMKEVDKMRK